MAIMKIDQNFFFLLDYIIIKKLINSLIKELPDALKYYKEAIVNNSKNF